MNYQLKFFVIGEKGGVGKTWFTFILIEFLRKIFGRLPTIVDMDISTPNIAKTYLKTEYERWLTPLALANSNKSSVFRSDAPNLVEEKEKTRLERLTENQISLTNDREGLMGDKLLEILDISEEVVVAMPSQSQQGLCEWLDRYLTKDNSDKDEEKEKAGIVFWWVSDGSFESLQLFDRFIHQYPPSELTQYCLVINKGSRDIDWSRYKLTDIYPDIFQLITAGEIKAIEIDKIGFEPKILLQVQQQGLSFTDIRNNNPKNNKYFINRFNEWLELCYDQILTTGYIPTVTPETVETLEKLFQVPADDQDNHQHGESQLGSDVDDRRTEDERHAA
jgi:hypothetical protein